MKFNTHPEKLDRSVFIHRMYSKKHKKATQPQLGIWLWLFHCPRPSFLAPKTYSSADGPARALLAQSMHVPGLAPGRSSRPTWSGWIHSTSWTRCWWWCCWKYWWWFRRRCWSSSQAERCHGIGCSCCCKRVRERKKIKMKSTLWTKFAKNKHRIYYLMKSALVSTLCQGYPGRWQTAREMRLRIKGAKKR